LRQAAEDILHFQACIEEYLSDTTHPASLGDVSHMLCEFARAAYPIMPNGCGVLFFKLTNATLPRAQPPTELQKARIPNNLFG